MADAHLLTVTQRWTDGHRDSWSSTQPGSASVAHEALAKRWAAAGFEHRRDKQALTLTAHRDLDGERYIETVQHSAASP